MLLIFVKISATLLTIAVVGIAFNYFWRLTRGKNTRIHKYEKSRIDNWHIVAALMGWALFIFNGFYGLLWFIPTHFMEAGDNPPLRISIAGMLTIAAMGALADIEKRLKQH